MTMHFSTIAAIGLLSLAALTPADANAQGQPYRAVGTEPFWSATIGARQMSFERSGERAITVAKPRAIVGFNGERYVTRSLTIDITHVECNDGMSDRTFKDTVTVTVGRRTYRGCGGTVLSEQPRGSIEGEWRISSIAGAPPVRGTQPSISFRNGRASGNTGCNSFNGSYSVRRGQLSAGPLATTRRACTDRGANAQERSILHILGQRLTVTPLRGGSIQLRGSQTIILSPQRR